MYADQSLVSGEFNERARVNLVFIDKSNYTALMDKSFNINDIPGLLEKPNEKVSMLTRAYFIHINERLNNILFDETRYYCNFDNIGIDRNNLDMNYIKDTFKEKMHLTGYCEKYYELRLLANRDILVIVCDGFLNNITESKDNLLKFILECLSYTYKLNYTIYNLLKLYVKVKLNEQYINMLKLRV